MDSRIKTLNGHYLDVFDPDPDQIDIEDIAHALSFTCRFSGQIKKFYSVADHSLRVCNRLPEKYKLEGLLHDASEAYLTDIPSPIKERLPEYKAIEGNLTRVINLKFGIPYPKSPIVKEMDHIMLEEEISRLRKGEGTPFRILKPSSVRLSFMGRFWDLTRA